VNVEKNKLESIFVVLVLQEMLNWQLWYKSH